MSNLKGLPVVKKYRSYDDKIATYRERLIRADRAFTDVEAKKRDALYRYKNRPKAAQITDQGHRVNVATGTAIIDSLYASLTAVTVDVQVRPVGDGTRLQGRIATEGIRSVWREQRVPRSAERATKEALIVGLGWVKVDYEYKETTIVQARDPEDMAQDVESYFTARRQELELRGGTWDEDAIARTAREVEENIETEEAVTEVQRDRVVVDNVPWDMVRWDPTAKRVDDIRWVAQYTLVPVHEVVENPTYREFVKKRKGGLKKLEEMGADQRVVKRVDPNTTSSESMHLQPSEDSTDFDRITLCELWDFETGTVCTFAKDSDLILHERPNPFFLHDDLVDKSPFVPLVLRQDPDSVWGLGDMELVMPSLDELNEYRSNLATFVALHIPKILAEEGTFTEAGKQALRSKQFGAVVELAQGKQANDVKDLTLPQLPQEAFNLPDKIENQIREATAVNELMRGIFPDRKRTATETSEVVSASATRQAEKRNLLERFYQDIARRVLVLMQVFYDKERMARLVEDEGDETWEWTGDDIVGDLDLEVNLTPKEAFTEQTRRDNVLALFNLLAPLGQFVDVAQLIKYGMEELGIKPEVIRNIVKTEDEQAAALAAETGQAPPGAGPAPGEEAPPGQGELPPADAEAALPPEVQAALAFRSSRGVGESGSF